MRFNVLLLVILLCGCGQTGPLYLPNQNQQQHQGRHGSL